MALEPRIKADARGLALPAIRTAGGYFASKGPHDVAWGNLLLSIFTRTGTRFMRRELGSGVADTIFEPQADQNPNLLDFIIRSAVEKDVPNIIIERIDVVPAGKSTGLRVSFHLEDDETVETRLIELRRGNIIKLLAGQG